MMSLSIHQKLLVNHLLQNVKLIDSKQMSVYLALMP